MKTDLRITAIEVVDFMRVKAFKAKIDPDKGLVTLGGENAQGKSSVLKAIEAALTPIPKGIKEPLREGGEMAKIRVRIERKHEPGQEQLPDLAYNVMRWWDAGGKPSLKIVRVDDGSQINNPSQFLKELLGEIFVDPVEFLGMQPIEQRKVLAEITGIDLTEIDAQIEQAVATQKHLEETQAKLKHMVEDLPFHENMPDGEISIGELTARLQQVIQLNAQNQRLRDQAAEAERNLEAASRRSGQQGEIIRELEERLALAQAEKKRCINAETKAQADALQASILVRDLVDEDLTPHQTAISAVEDTNRKVRDNQARLKARAEWEVAETELGTHIERVKELNLDRKRKLAEAEFPVPGLGFDAKQVTFNGQPLSQASGAEGLRVSTAISLARRKQLAPVLIHEASTMDAKSLAIIAEEAQKRGSQVFAAITCNKTGEGFDRECAIYIEDGELVASTEPASKEEQPK